VSVAPLPKDGSANDGQSPLPAIGNALDCPTYFTRCATRGGLFSHRVSHLRASNAAGERGRGRAAGRSPPTRPTNSGEEGAAGSAAAATSSGASSAPAVADARTGTPAEPVAHGLGSADISRGVNDEGHSGILDGVTGGGTASNVASLCVGAHVAAGDKEPGGHMTAGGDETSDLAAVDGAVNVAVVEGSGNDESRASTQTSPLTLGGESPCNGSAAGAAIDSDKNIDKAVLMRSQSFMAVLRHAVGEPDSRHGRKRSHVKHGGSATCTDPEYMYTTVSTAMRAINDDEADWDRSSSLSTRRKGWRPSQFDSFRLRAVERFALECGGGGLSLEGIEKLWDLLDTWDGTKPGMPRDDGHEDSLRDSFKSVNAFKDDIHDDVDDAVLGAGWLKCPLVVDGLK